MSTIAFLIAFLVAYSELLSRYTEGPFEILLFKESWIYLVINGLSGLLTYFIILRIDIQFVFFNSIEATKAVISGLGSMAILRSSISKIKVNGSIVDIGFEPLLMVFLTVVDRAFDRKRAIKRTQEITEIMSQINFEKAKENLPIFCLTVMRNLSAEEQKIVGEEVKKLDERVLAPRAKALALGSVLAEFTGTDLLKEVVKSLKADIEYSKEDKIEMDETMKNIDELINRIGQK